MTDTDTKTLEAKCSCGSIHFTIDVPRASLPLGIIMCHCSFCRWGSGAPCIFHAELPEGVIPKFVAPSSKANLTRYIQEGREWSWSSCSTCGCHVGAVEPDDSSWTLSPSMFLDYSPETFQVKMHAFSKSAKDCGIAPMLKRVGDRKVGDWNPKDDDPTAEIRESPAEVGDDGAERLRAKCLCGGVSFTIKRPVPDLGKDEFFSSIVSPVDPTKWMASLDVCSDCRLVDGTHVVGWTFVPLSTCEPPIKPDLQIGTSKTYASSPGVLRSFCGTCGATVFYTCDDRKKEDGRQIVDLATGMLRAPEGAMAANWLTWRSRIGGAESGKKFDREFCEGLEEGMKAYSMEKNGRELNERIG